MIETSLPALRQRLDRPASFGRPQVLVLFGELFQRGYATGLVDEAKIENMDIFFSTVGRREKDGTVRPLTADEIQTEKNSSASHFLNHPLEAGFDSEKIEASGRGSVSACDLIANLKISNWQEFEFPAGFLERARAQGEERLRRTIREWVTDLRTRLPKNAEIHFAHLMAGGVPRAKIFMPILNRVFKGFGDRYLSSETFWNSGLGRFAQINFDEVTANTFRYLIEETANLRKEFESQGSRVTYSAFGYHGTEILLRDEYRWQSYAPYLQGFAKVHLESLSENFFAQGIKTCVYNAPEILTNSSSVFQGLEIPLYPLLLALKRNAAGDRSENIWNQCRSLLKPEVSVQQVLQICEQALSNPAVVAQSKFKNWPQHSTPLQLQSLLDASDQIRDLHLSEKNLFNFELSEIVFKACGLGILLDRLNVTAPVKWIGHDFIANNLQNI